MSFGGKEDVFLHWQDDHDNNFRRIHNSSKYNGVNRSYDQRWLVMLHMNITRQLHQTHRFDRLFLLSKHCSVGQRESTRGFTNDNFTNVF